MDRGKHSRSSTSSSRAGGALATFVAVLGVSSVLLALVAAHARPDVRAETVAPPTPPVPNSPYDTIYGAAVFDIPSGDSAIHVEEFNITFQPGSRYTLLVENGDGGNDEVDSARVTLNGIERISSSQALASGTTLVEVFGMPASNELTVELWGPTDSEVTISIMVNGAPWTQILIQGMGHWTSGPPTVDTAIFDLPEFARPPYGLHLTTGYPPGTYNVTDGWADMNGVEIFGSSDFDASLMYLEAEVSLQDSANLLELGISAPVNGQIDSWITALVFDTIPPEIEITSPQGGVVTAEDSILVQGVARDQWAKDVFFEIGAELVDIPRLEEGDSAFSTKVPLPAVGSNTIEAHVSDLGWNQDVDSVVVTRDPNAPVLDVTAPTDGLVINADSVTVTGSVTDQTATTVTANSVPLPVDGAGQFTGTIAVSEGANFVTVVATDEASNTAQVVHVVTRDTQDPSLTVTAPTDGSSTTADSVDVTGSVTDATDVTLTLNSMAVALDSVGDFDKSVVLVSGTNVLAFLATDEAGNTSVDTVTVTQTGSALPPNPEMVAPDVEANVATTIGNATAFLYEGSNPIQTGVTAGAIDTVRAAVLKGRVLDRAGQPLSGVTVSVLGRAEFGQTLTRADGEYDLVVNGGGYESVRFVRSGYPEVQRRAQLPWQDYVVLDDVAMTPLDTTVTVIDFTDPVEVARGTPQTDSDGTRQATLMFKQGTVATAIDTDGTVDTLSSISVRATEYTVGSDGQEAMPGALPVTNVYTYAVELSVDEAAGGERVEFSEPVAFYLENFLDIPVGGEIPIGYFDRTQGEWNAELDGRVIEVVDIDSLGVASLNIDTISGAEHADTLLAHLGIDADELEAIGSTYSVGDTLWRGESTHFSPFDYNFSARMIDFFNDVWEFLSDPAAPDETVPDDCNRCDGSIINVEGQYVDEIVPVVGTPYTLNYSSIRMPGRQAAFRLDVPVTGDSIPTLLDSAQVDIEVAGRSWRYMFAADTSITHTFYWDGRDAYDRLVFGQQRVKTKITYLFRDVPTIARFGGGRRGSSFGSPRGGDLTAVTVRENPGVRIEWAGRIGTRSIDTSLGGWTFSQHHSYDPIANRLYLGDGTNRSSRLNGNVVNTIAGTGAADFDADAWEDSLAVESAVSSPVDVEVLPDGSVLYIENVHDRVRRIDPDGIIRPFAGGGTLTPDSVPADSASITNPVGMALGPDGSLWIASTLSSLDELYRVWPDGIIERYGGAPGYAGDGGLVSDTTVRFNNLTDVAVGPDGAVYVLHGDGTSADCIGGRCRRVRRIGPDGIISTIAGTGADGYSGDGGPATAAVFSSPSAVAVGRDGRVFVADNDLIRVITPDGDIARFAGAGGLDYEGDLGPALDAEVWVAGSSLETGSDGSVYFSHRNVGVVRRINASGIITTVAGTGTTGFSGDGGRALAAEFDLPQGLALSPEGQLYIADTDDHRIRRLGSSLPGYDAGGHLIAAADGSAVYQFDAEGRHLETLSTLTGATLFSFAYDSLGQLSSITDGDGLETTVARNGSGEPTSVTGPFGQVTTLSVGTDGYLDSITNPASEAHSFVMDSLGLIEEFITPTADTTRMVYDGDGRLTQHTAPDGRSTTLSRTVAGDSVTFSMTRGGRTSTYLVEWSDGGTVRRVTTDPAGFETATLQGSDAETTSQSPDSTARSSTELGDPRFGMEAPVVASAQLDLPSGLTSTLLGGRSVTLSDSTNPLSLVSALDTVVLNGRTYRSSYTAATRTLTTTTPFGRETVSVLDSLERLRSHTVTGLDSVAFTYNTNGLLTQAAQGARSWTFDYDASGRLQAATDPLSRTDSLSYDSADRVTRQVLADGEEITYGYDDSGRLTSLTPPGRSAHVFTYNAAGLDSIYNPPDVVGLSEDRTFYSYNANRELIEIERPDAQTIDFAYDSAGRVDSVTIPRGTLDYGYDATTGQLASIIAPGSDTLTFGYDGVLPTSESWSGSIDGTVAFAYDSDLRLSGLAVGTDTIDYGYDTDGLLTAAGELTLVRDSLNGLLTATSLDTVTTTTSYNTFGEPAADSTWAGATLLLARTYARDDLGRITEVIDWADSVTTIWGYDYDDVGRLETVTQDSTAYSSYTYDANGNRLTRTSGAGTEAGVYDAQDRLTSYDGATYEYTAAGELERRIEGTDTTTYGYDVLGNLTDVELPDGTLIEYTIDGRNRRVGRSVDGDLLQGLLYGDQLNPVAELDSTGAVVSRFVYGSKANVPDYMVRGGTTYRIVSDHLGSVRLVVNAGTGAITQAMSYDAWGRVLTDTNPGFQPFGFAGGIWDTETGLVRFGARDYDATAGRWTAKDPIGFAATGTNLHAYSGNEPVNRIDPTGMDFRERFVENLAINNRFFFGGLSRLSRSALGSVTAGATARGIGGVTLFELLRTLPAGGYPALGGVAGTGGAFVINSAVNALLVAAVLEVGIVIGSALDALFCEEFAFTYEYLRDLYTLAF